PTGVDENGNNYADDKNNYNISNTWPYASNQSYTLEFYDPDKNNSAEIIVYQSSPAVKSTTYSPVFLVGSVGEMTIGDEVVQTASGLVLGQELSLTAENVGDFDHLKPGDAIKFHMNGDGRADYVEVMC